jgi:hypothetical protein
MANEPPGRGTISVRWSDATEYTSYDDALRKRISASQYIGTATREAEHCEALYAQAVDHPG